LEVAAIVTANAERAAQAAQDHPGARVLGSADEVWARPEDYDLVVVAAPNSVHVPLAEAAVRAGLAVVVDKPFAPTAASGEQLVEQARAAGVPLTVFHNRRWDDDFLALRELLEAGTIGDVVRIESRFDRWKPTLEGDRWRERAGGSEAGGLLFDLGSHLIDQARILCGEPASGYAELDLRRDGAEVDDDSFLALGFGTGPRVHLWMSVLAADPAPRFRVAGTQGAIEITGLDPQEAALRSGLRPDSDGWADALAGREARITVVAGGTMETQTRPIGPGRYSDFYVGVRDMVAEGGPPPVAPEDGVAVLRVIERARAAAAGSSPG
jgi:predicted dehydrogenase